MEKSLSKLWKSINDQRLVAAEKKCFHSCLFSEPWIGYCESVVDRDLHMEKGFGQCQTRGKVFETKRSFSKKRICPMSNMGESNSNKKNLFFL